MSRDIERTARENLADILGGAQEPQALELDRDLAHDYGLTSINKVMFLTSLCQDAEIDMGTLTEEDVAAMRTLRQITDVLEANRART